MEIEPGASHSRDTMICFMFISLDGCDVAAVSFQQATFTVTEVMEKQSQRITVSHRGPLFEYCGIGNFQRNGSLYIFLEDMGGAGEVSEKQMWKIRGKIKPNNPIELHRWLSGKESI